MYYSFLLIFCTFIINDCYFPLKTPRVLRIRLFSFKKRLIVVPWGLWWTLNPPPPPHNLRVPDNPWLLFFMTVRQNMAILIHYKTPYIAKFWNLSLERSRWSYDLMTRRSWDRILKGALFSFKKKLIVVPWGPWWTLNPPPPHKLRILDTTWLQVEHTLEFYINKKLEAELFP